MIVKRNFGGNRATTRVFVLSSHKMTNGTANVTLITVFTNILYIYTTLDFKWADLLSLLRKKSSVLVVEIQLVRQILRILGRSLLISLMLDLKLFSASTINEKKALVNNFRPFTRRVAMVA